MTHRDASTAAAGWIFLGLILLAAVLVVGFLALAFAAAADVVRQIAAVLP